LRTVNRSAAALLAVAILAAAIVAIGLELQHNTHSRLAFDFLLYGTVLPAILWFWWENRSGNAEPSSFPDLRVSCAIVFGLITGITGFSYNHGHTLPDESSYLFQARVFAAGEAKAEPMPGAQASSPAAPPEIYFEHQAHTTRGWFSKYPPGWPLALAAAYLLGCPWLLNPALGLALLALVNHLARPWGRATQNLAVLLTAFSAYTMLYSTGFLSHAFITAIGMAAIAAAFHGVRTERLAWITLCFLLVVASTEIRPYTGAVIALWCVGYTVMALWRKPGLFWRSAAVIVLAGVASLALLLCINRVYTGSYLVSPYAYSRGLTKVKELTFSPSLIAQNLAGAWRWALTDTLAFSFPLVFAAALYAVFNERVFRRELITLSLLFPMLIGAYIFQSESSSSFDGERYYYEGYAALCIVAARGYLLLMERWRVRRRAATAGVAALAALHVVFIAIMLHDVQVRVAPWRSAYQASIAQPRPALVFLGGTSSAFAPKHANWNDPRWQTARTIFLNDPGPSGRNPAACRFHRPAYRVVTYDVKSERVLVSDHAASCSGENDERTRAGKTALSVMAASGRSDGRLDGSRVSSTRLAILPRRTHYNLLAAKLK